MSNKVEMAGKRFGRLMVIRESLQRLSGVIAWDCLCDCGKSKSIMGKSMRSGKTKSCGCLKTDVNSKVHTTHGMTFSSEYNSWRGMVQRCLNPNYSQYEYYGGRGITVCERWLHFENFYKDMGTMQKGLTIERKDNGLGYFKKNCYWASCATQAQNRRLFKNNKTGINGVHYCNTKQKYIAQIGVNHKQLQLGAFFTLLDAKMARKKAEQKYWGGKNNE